MFDLLIIGSGPSGAITADYFVNKGYKVALLDSGADSSNVHPINEKHFLEHKEDPGNDFFLAPQNLKSSADTGNAQLTRSRQHMLEHVETFLKISSNTYNPSQTLATGGLSAAWGAACFTFEKDDLKRAQLPDLSSHYHIISERIGISGPKESMLCSLSNKQKSAKTDHNGLSILKYFNQKSDSLLKRNFVVENASLALLSQDLGSRRKTNYFDMDFYTNFGSSVFRADILINELSKKSNFTRIKNAIAFTFAETENGAQISYQNIATQEQLSVSGKKLILCCGAINSYRLAANALNIFDKPNPILTNPYIYIPTSHWPNIGKQGARDRHSLSQLFGQLTLPNKDKITLQFYSYRSLLLSRLIAQTPMPTFFARQFWRSLAESLVIVGAHFPDDGSSKRSMHAQQCGTILPTLAVNFPTPSSNGLSSIIRNLLSLKCIPMGLVKTKMGGSIHYAGTIPNAPQGAFPITLDDNAKLHGTKNVYVFDSSGWNYLPSRGLTLTIMANAYRLSELLHTQRGST